LGCPPNPRKDKGVKKGWRNVKKRLKGTNLQDGKRDKKKTYLEEKEKWETNNTKKKQKTRPIDSEIGKKKGGVGEAEGKKRPHELASGK